MIYFDKLSNNQKRGIMKIQCYFCEIRTSLDIPSFANKIESKSFKVNNNHLRDRKYNDDTLLQIQNLLSFMLDRDIKKP